MIIRKRLVVLWCLLIAVAAEETSGPGQDKENGQDLVAEASNTGAQAQKREAALSNSYGEPLPSDAYGPPRGIPNIIPDLPVPAAVYGVPEQQNIFPQDPPPGAYGPPSPVVFPNQNYEGPPPPVGKPKPIYGPPKHFGPPKSSYGPPKPIYGPPKKQYGPPKQNLPKPIYGVPFKPPKISIPKPIYGVPKPIYGPPKPVYGPPKATYGPPANNPIPELSAISLPQSSVITNFGFDTNVDLGLSLPAPIYGTPINLPNNLQPNFPIPSDSYGPPGHSLGPIGPNDQVVLHDSISGHYGPPQPDPNPRPPHPGIPAPPTPPHVLYDGWKPIPGVSKPLLDNVHGNHGHGNIGHGNIEHGNNGHGNIVHGNIGHNQNFDFGHGNGNIDFGNNIIGDIHGRDQYGPPPPPPPQIQEVHLNLEGNALPSAESHSFSSGAQINTGYSSVHQDALANIDLNAIVGGDSNHIDQSKTVFEAHYIENAKPQEAPIIQAPINFDKPQDSYGAPPSESLFGGPYPPSPRQHGAKGLVPPSGVYGVPPGGQYGAPPRFPHSHGPPGGRGHFGHAPRHPIKFREPVPEGLLQNIGHTSHQKDVLGLNHHHQGPTYLPPPIREIKDINQHTGNRGVSLSIEPSNLYSLPHAGTPINFHPLQQPSDLYGSPIDSYSVPLHTVGDHTVSSSNTNAVAATVDGTIFANLSNLDAAAILKHCPYHEAILRAAKLGDKIPSDLATSYVASLSSLGSTLSKSQQTLISPFNGFNNPAPGSESVSYNTKDLSTASHTLVETILPSNDIRKEKTEKGSVQKGKSIKDNSGKHGYKQDDRLQFVSQQIQQTSEKIRNLSEETKQLQQKIVSGNQNLQQGNGQQQFGSEIPIKGKHTSYSLQIQSADDGLRGKAGPPSIPHEQLLSEGLLQSILQAIEQPSQSQQQPQPQIKVQNQQVNFQQSGSMDLSNIDVGGLVLPAGYEPVDRTREKSKAKDQETQSSNVNMQYVHNNNPEHSHRGDIPHSDCDLRADNSITHIKIVPAPNVENVKALEDIDNDVAIYFGENAEDKEKNEPVTEISVATSISENTDQYGDSKEFGSKIVKS